MHEQPQLRFTCIKCHQPTDAPLCERCEQEVDELVVDTLDTLANGSAHQRSYRARKEAR